MDDLNSEDYKVEELCVKNSFVLVLCKDGLWFAAPTRRLFPYKVTMQLFPIPKADDIGLRKKYNLIQRFNVSELRRLKKK